MMKKTLLSILVLFLSLIMLHGCGDSGSSSSTGTLSLSLTDAASGDYKAVYVTIKQIQVHRDSDAEGVWKTISSPGRTYNLLDLVNGLMEQLALSTLETGTYSQMRLVIGDVQQSGQNILGQDHPYANYVIDSSNGYHELKIPSGYETGIKLVHEFVILEGLTTDLIVDFDVEKSIVRAAGEGRWQLKPTIKVIGTLNKATVSGMITTGSNTPVAGAWVSAQRYDQETHEVEISAATLTDGSGEYQMYLDPGMYAIVVYKDGFLPACSILMTGSNEDYDQSCSLAPCSMGTVSCTVTLAQGVQDQVVDVHFLKVSPLDEGSSIEVKVFNVSQSGSYPVELPAGAYLVIASNGVTTLPVQNASTGGQVTLAFTASD
jgi:hypothetical protein